jgi:hypothetical protein
LVVERTESEFIAYPILRAGWVVRQPASRGDAPQLEMLASVIGDECGQTHKMLLDKIAELRAAHRLELDALHAEIGKLRRELDSGVIELPGPPKDWRNAATH